MINSGATGRRTLQRIESSSPPVRALGVTDDFCIRTYREVRKRQQQGRLSNVEFIFPNVEMRLDIKTKEQSPINVHLLFSPSDSDHEAQIERILALLMFEFQERQYRCTVGDLVQLGRAFDPGQTNDEGALRAGANQFKTTLPALRELFRKERWVRQIASSLLHRKLVTGHPVCRTMTPSLRRGVNSRPSHT